MKTDELADKWERARFGFITADRELRFDRDYNPDDEDDRRIAKEEEDRRTARHPDLPERD